MTKLPKKIVPGDMFRPSLVNTVNALIDYLSSPFIRGDGVTVLVKRANGAFALSAMPRGGSQTVKIPTYRSDFAAVQVRDANVYKVKIAAGRIVAEAGTLEASEQEHTVAPGEETLAYLKITMDNGAPSAALIVFASPVAADEANATVASDGLPDSDADYYYIPLARIVDPTPDDAPVRRNLYIEQIQHGAVVFSGRAGANCAYDGLFAVEKLTGTTAKIAAGIAYVDKQTVLQIAERDSFTLGSGAGYIMLVLTADISDSASGRVIGLFSDSYEWITSKDSATGVTWSDSSITIKILVASFDSSHNVRQILRSPVIALVHGCVLIDSSLVNILEVEGAPVESNTYRIKLKPPESGTRALLYLDGTLNWVETIDHSTINHAGLPGVSGSTGG